MKTKTATRPSATAPARFQKFGKDYPDVMKAYEALATPLTYAVVRYVKRKEGIDAYDRQVSLNPFAFGR